MEVVDYIEFEHYYPFGMVMPGRSFSSNLYRYGFNGMEKDDEMGIGDGNSYTAQFWQYDARLGRRWNQDPKPNPSISNYAAFANNPIFYSDHLGDTIADMNFMASVLTTIGRAVNSDFRNKFRTIKESTETFSFVATKGNGEQNLGSVSYDGDNIIIAFQYGKRKKFGHLGDSPLAALYHETTHGTQFLDGKFSFKFIDNVWKYQNYDWHDEIEAFTAQWIKGDDFNPYNGAMETVRSKFNKATTVEEQIGVLDFWYPGYELGSEKLGTTVLKKTSSSTVYQMPNKELVEQFHKEKETLLSL